MAPLKLNLTTGIFLTSHGILIDTTTLLSALESQQNTDRKNVILCWNINSFVAAKNQVIVLGTLNTPLDSKHILL